MKVVSCLFVVVLAAVFACSSCSSFYGSVVDNQVKQIESLNTMLAGVNDRASADAAAGQLDRYGEGFAEVFKGISSSGKPSILELLRMKSQLESQATSDAARELITQCVRLGVNNFYGSELLKQGLLNQAFQVQRNLGGIKM